MISASLKSKFDDYKTMNSSLVSVVVELENSSLITVLAEKLLAELQRVAPYASFAPVAELESRDIERYLNTLTWMRVCAVNRSADKSWLAYKPLERSVTIPVLMYQLLICIGTAYDADYNIEFTPAYRVKQDDILSPAEMDKVSSLFRQFEQSGIKVVYGMPRDLSGELEFMAMAHVSEEIMSYKRSHPVYGFLAAFFRQQTFNEIVGSMNRILYGYESDFRLQVDALMNAIDG